jgi:hypothetical protein
MKSLGNDKDCDMLRALLILACVMVIAGAAAMINGSGMILNERGWSQLIAGSVVLTGGLIVTALAGVLYHVQTLWEKDRLSVTQTSDAAPQPVLSVEQQPISPTALPDITAHDTHRVRDGMTPAFYERATPHALSPQDAFHTDLQASAPVEQHHGQLNHELAQLNPSHKNNPHTAPVQDDPQPVFVSLPDADYDQFKPMAQPTGAQGAVPFSPEPSLTTRDAPAPRPQLKQPSLFEVVQDQHQGFGVTPSSKPAPHMHPDALHPSAPVLPAEPVVAAPPEVPQAPQAPKERLLLASYSTGGVGYFMYSDQSIEAEMAIGRYRFNSMDELRTFIETQVGGERVSD